MQKKTPKSGLAALSLMVLPALMAGIFTGGAGAASAVDLAKTSAEAAVNPGMAAKAKPGETAEAVAAPVLKLEAVGTLGQNGWYTSYETYVKFRIQSAWGAQDTVKVTLSNANESVQEWSGIPSRDVRLTNPGVTDVVVTATKANGDEVTEMLRIKYDPSAPHAVPKGKPATVRIGDSWRVDFECTDSTSGIASCEAVGYARGDLITFTEKGTFFMDIRARDYAGNVALQQVYINVLSADQTPPVLTVDVPEANAAGWHRGPVTLTMNATDEGDGPEQFWIEYKNYTHLQPIGRNTFKVEGDGVHDLIVGAKDAAGNFSIPRSVAIKIDGTKPTLDVKTAVPASARYAVGQAVRVAFTCADARSGIQTCGGDLAPGGKLPTGTAGKKSVILRAVDAAGNVSTRTLQYTVAKRLTATPKPKISGALKVGKKLMVKVGHWKPARVALKYQWLRNGKVISGATKMKYKVIAKDRGKKISVRVTGAKSGYITISKTSSAKRVSRAK